MTSNTNRKKITTNKITASNTHLSTVTLNTNCLNFLIKRHRLVGQIKKKNPFICYVKKLIIPSMIDTTLKE